MTTLDAAPIPTPIPAREPEMALAHRAPASLVLAEWMRNFGGGVAVACVVLALGVGGVYFAALPITPNTLLVAAGIAGLVWFGCVQAWRSVIDELRQSWRLREWVAQWEAVIALLTRDNDALKATLKEVVQERDACKRESERLSAENASLHYEWRKAKATPRTIQSEDLIPRQTRDDARHIVRVWAETGKRPGRADLVPGDMTRARWDDAYRELVRAGVVGATEPLTEAEMLHRLSVRWAAPVDYRSNDDAPGGHGLAARPALEVGGPGRPAMPGQGGQ